MNNDITIIGMLNNYAKTVMIEQFQNDHLSIMDIGEIWGMDYDEITKTLEDFGILKENKYD